METNFGIYHMLPPNWKEGRTDEEITCLERLDGRVEIFNSLFHPDYSPKPKTTDKPKDEAKELLAEYRQVIRGGFEPILKATAVGNLRQVLDEAIGLGLKDLRPVAFYESIIPNESD